MSSIRTYMSSVYMYMSPQTRLFACTLIRLHARLLTGDCSPSFANRIGQVGSEDEVTTIVQTAESPQRNTEGSACASPSQTFHLQVSLPSIHRSSSPPRLTLIPHLSTQFRAEITVAALAM
jgi:hypothetical protein